MPSHVRACTGVPSTTTSEQLGRRALAEPNPLAPTHLARDERRANGKGIQGADPDRGTSRLPIEAFLVAP
jgi:hypothetical protein